MVKRGFDLIVAATLLIVLSPVLLAAAISIRATSPGPALFRQRRIGRRSVEFTILKFRTMKIGTPDLASHLVGPGSGRVTGLGYWLRRTSVDELPQLWNILRGEMTLVGPRPALYNQDDLIVMRRAAGVDALAPGVTGWAQIHGRDEIPMTEKVARDRWYLEHCSFATDLWILMRTAVTLFSSRGVY
ncbi:MAG: sugar transferase [Candidatus Eisenbacteria bacterium]|uniref:Sugar transferase n=1 Tax=Eiseniibacteriota bacterium TaxID=2212470 RepID=A0A9D6QJ11_UNCEI|nr:sugar transferase [Candidatus Eisenbacteria bacterium]MBI3540037.1 sugar transferase [Candidatus Eisenbacteria bacterium]